MNKTRIKNRKQHHQGTVKLSFCLTEKEEEEEEKTEKTQPAARGPSLCVPPTNELRLSSQASSEGGESLAAALGSLSTRPQ